MDALAKKYEGSVDFVFIYCDDQHAMLPAPAETREERAEHAREFRRLAKARKQVLVDQLGDAGVKRLYKIMGNAVFVIDREGGVAAKMANASSLILEKELQALAEP